MIQCREMSSNVFFQVLRDQNDDVSRIKTTISRNSQPQQLTP